MDKSKSRRNRSTHAADRATNGGVEARGDVNLDAHVRGRKLREWFSYLAACENQGMPAYGVPEEIRQAWAGRA